MIASPIVELRQYALRPGQRDTLIDLFDRELVEPQEAVGMAVLGQFRDLDAADRFVWLRGFPDMGTRAESLAAFYGGPAWKAHGRAANATMVDSDDVLLLRPLSERWELPECLELRPPVGRSAPASVVLATIFFADRPIERPFSDVAERELYPILAAGGCAPFACLATEYAENTFPDLPVRTGEHVFAWFTRFDGLDELDDHVRAVEEANWPSTIKQVQQLRLAPTGRSLLK